MKRSKSPRTTVSVSELTDFCNQMLARKDVAPEFRKGIMVVLEEVLFATQNYHGFNYIAWAREGGYEAWCKDGKPRPTTSYLGDQTRVVYY